MTTRQYLEVGGGVYYVEPKRTLDVVVPAGLVTTELIGHEPPKYWWVSGPDYYQQVIIGPSSAHSLAVWKP